MSPFSLAVVIPDRQEAATFMPDIPTVTELLLRLSLKQQEPTKLSDSFRSAVIADKEQVTRTQLAAALYNVNQAKLMLEQAAWDLQPGSYHTQNPNSPKARVA